jgi:hypothetical protein
MRFVAISGLPLPQFPHSPPLIHVAPITFTQTLLQEGFEMSREKCTDGQKMSDLTVSRRFWSRCALEGPASDGQSTPSLVPVPRLGSWRHGQHLRGRYRTILELFPRRFVNSRPHPLPYTLLSVIEHILKVGAVFGKRRHCGLYSCGLSFHLPARKYNRKL